MYKEINLFFLLLLTTLSSSAQKCYDVKGKVIDDAGKGIPEVVVNNGVRFTQTDGDGCFSLTTDTAVSKFISISVPAAYQIETEQGLATKFYRPVRSVLKNGTGATFKLLKRSKPSDSFSYIAISDPQVKTQDDLKRWLTEAIPDIRQTVQALNKKQEVIGMTLGDLVYDNMSLYPPYKKSLQNLGMTVFQCIGNHDFDKTYQDLHNSAYGTENYAEQVYGKYFGPTNYSFNIGKVHVITFKSINYMGQKKYTESLTGQDLDWIKQDLSYIPKGTTVFMNTHAAGWNTVDNEGNIRNNKELAALLRDYNVHFFCGHTHYMQNIAVTPKLYQHNIGAVCGAWWAGNINRCGAPNGYLIVHVDGTDVSWQYKSTGYDISYQMRVYQPGEFLTHQKDVVANVWDWDINSHVEWYQDGKPMGEMQQFSDVDEMFAQTCDDRTKAGKTSHLFCARPKGEYHQIKVIFTDSKGQKYQSIITK